MIDLLMMIALTCSNIAVDKKECTKNILTCSVGTWDQLKRDIDVKRCVLKEIEGVKDERKNN